MNTRPSFFASLQPVRKAVLTVVETASQKITDAILIAGLAKRSAEKGFTMIDIGDGSFAFHKTDNDTERYPIVGGYSLDDAGRFVLARERESIW